MGDKKVTAMLLAVALMVLAFGGTTTTTEAYSDCVNNCMPTCLQQVKSAGTHACELACQQFCDTDQGQEWDNLAIDRGQNSDAKQFFNFFAID